MVSLSSIQISPRSEIKIHYANNKRFLIRVIRVICVNPRFRQLIHIARWGNQSSVCSRAIYRTFFLGERHTERAYYLALRAQLAPIEEQQPVAKSRDSEIPPTRKVASNQGLVAGKSPQGRSGIYCHGKPARLGNLASRMERYVVKNRLLHR